MKLGGVFKKITHKRINTLLSLVLLLLAGYIILWPFLPSLNWWVRFEAPVISAITKPRVERAEVPDTNTLVMPALGLSEQILEGPGIETVNKGVWRRPNTSTPDQGSNTVLVGHRFTYAGNSVFYNLDKVKVGDEITLYWYQKPYLYKVDQVVTVPSEAVSVEALTTDPVLTLYTCTPLLTAKDRLVIRARLVNE